MSNPNNNLPPTGIWIGAQGAPTTGGASQQAQQGGLAGLQGQFQNYPTGGTNQQSYPLSQYNGPYPSTDTLLLTEIRDLLRRSRSRMG